MVNADIYKSCCLIDLCCFTHTLLFKESKQWAERRAVIIQPPSFITVFFCTDSEPCECGLLTF